MGFLKPKVARSDNANMGLINSTYGGMMNQGTGANSNLAALLTGQGNVADAQQGLQNYLSMAGFAPAMRQMSQATTGQGAASGLLRSGITANRLQTRGTELNQNFTNNYLQQLAGLSGLGLQAGGLVTNAGQRSTGGGPSTLGSIASAAGGIASIFSDRRLKTDIVKIGEEPDGLGIYEFRYLLEQDRVIGVMADEVAKLRPHALGPIIQGYATVDYGAL
jgi:hypothetical protein